MHYGHGFGHRGLVSTKTANASMSIGTWLSTQLTGVRVGKDSAGNVYYRERGKPTGRRSRRWVIYKGRPEASAVPPEWHAWLHHTVDEPLQPVEQPWAKPHQANRTGTTEAYVPAGDERGGGTRRGASGDYQAWTPGD